MNYLGIEYQVRNLPELDPAFIPMEAWMRAYLAEADRPIKIAVEREDRKISIYETFLRAKTYEAANFRFLERIVKFLLWSAGGFRIYICGCDDLTAQLAGVYCEDGARAFDCGFMYDVYESKLEVIACSEWDFPAKNEQSAAIGGHLAGCRIGFDAGGSDRKVSAVVDGEIVYSEEVVWLPKESTDINYQYEGILESLRTAADKMPRVDAIGISTAGVIVKNQPMVSSIFLKIPRRDRELVKSAYIRACKAMGDIPYEVANDGDVSALAGSMSLGEGSLMGVAMGTSVAVGYVDHECNVLGWLNELAFAPVDLHENAMADEWSTDIGVACKYLSQDAVNKLLPAAGLVVDEALSLAEKLQVVQEHMEKGEESAKAIFRSIGVYFAHTIALYHRFYDIRHLILMGRVSSGTGGALLLETCNRVLAEEYPEVAAKIQVSMPNETMRRVGQSVAAASLPEVKK